MYLTTLLMLTVIVSVSYGYQAGAPPGTCEPMTPFHGGSAQTVGSLTNTDGTITTANPCSGAAALTHTESGDKSSFQFSWKHSGTSTDNIYIVCTVVQAKLTYWEKLSSAAITYNGTSTVCSGTVHTIPCVLLMCICIVLNMVTILLQ